MYLPCSPGSPWKWLPVSEKFHSLHYLLKMKWEMDRIETKLARGFSQEDSFECSSSKPVETKRGLVPRFSHCATEDPGSPGGGWGLGCSFLLALPLYITMPPHPCILFLCCSNLGISTISHTAILSRKAFPASVYKQILHIPLHISDSAELLIPHRPHLCLL